MKTPRTRKQSPVKTQTQVEPPKVRPLLQPQVLRHNSKTAIEIHRENERSFFIHRTEDQRVVVDSEDSTVLLRRFQVLDYPVALGAFRYLNPSSGAVPMVSDTARAVLVLLIKTYAVNEGKGKRFILKFIDTPLQGEGVGKLTLSETATLKALLGSSTPGEKDVSAEIKSLLTTTENHMGKKNGKKTGTKMEKAYAIFGTMCGKNSRADVIEAFQKRAGLTKAGSSTYYYLCQTRMKKECRAAGKPMPVFEKPSKANGSKAPKKAKAAKPKKAVKPKKAAKPKKAKATAPAADANKESAGEEQTAQ